MTKRRYKIHFFPICDSPYKNAQDRHWEELEQEERDVDLWVFEYTAAPGRTL